MRIHYFLVLLLSCTASPGEPAKVIPVNIPEVVKVRTVTASRKPVRRFILGEGVVRMSDEWVITSASGGITKSIFVKSGDWVDAGDTLLLFDRREEEISLATARSEVSHASYELENMRMGYGSVSLLQMDTVRQALSHASGFTRAVNALDLALKKYEDKVITAKEAGRLVGWTVQRGEYVDSGSRLGRIYRPGRVEIDIKLLELDLKYLSPGMDATGNTLSGIEFAARLSRVDPLIDKNGRINTVWRITTAAEFYPGMHVELQGETVLDTGVVVPIEAVTERAGKAVVFIQESDSARWKNVKTGWIDQDMVEIVDGINPGEQVIVSNQYSLNEGTPVISLK